MKKSNIEHEIVKKVLQDFPETPSLTLAKKIYKENPTVFISVEQIRDKIRQLRGRHGRAAYNKLTDKTSVISGDPNFSPFDKLPEGLRDYGQWEPINIESEATLILSDAHVPYHNTEALKTALEYADSFGISAIIFLGDFIDFYSLSRWVNDPRLRNIQEELDKCKTVFEILREVFPDVDMYYLLGNHEERLERYLRVKAPELLGYRALEYTEMIDARRFKIRIVDQKRILKIGKLNCIHGHEFGRTISNPVNPARGLYLRGKDNALCGHFHQTSQHVEKSMNSKIISCWSVGCLCDLRPEYLPINKWNHGFAIVLNTKDGFQVLNRSIINKNVY
jgi:predicted phosphodiesterase